MMVANHKYSWSRDTQHTLMAHQSRKQTSILFQVIFFSSGRSETFLTVKSYANQLYSICFLFRAAADDRRRPWANTQEQHQTITRHSHMEKE